MNIVHNYWDRQCVIRIKERKKYGLRGARRAPQYSKR
ncbi:30S ribosomal protein S9 [Mesoplasma florum]|nr:30S ribosomal protein S9 [Mesoplasma florum]